MLHDDNGSNSYLIPISSRINLNMATENTITDDLQLLIAADTYVVKAGLTEINSHTDFKCNIRTANEFDEIKQIMIRYDIEILIVGITSKKEWLDYLIDLTNNQKFKEVKI